MSKRFEVFLSVRDKYNTPIPNTNLFSSVILRSDSKEELEKELMESIIPSYSIGLSVLKDTDHHIHVDSIEVLE